MKPSLFVITMHTRSIFYSSVGHSSTQEILPKPLVALIANRGSTQFWMLRSVVFSMFKTFKSVMIHTPSPTPSRSHTHGHWSGQVDAADVPLVVDGQHPHASFPSRNAPAPIQTDLLDG